jgi:RHS repeat-associated protein
VECEPDGTYTATFPKGGSRRYAPLVQEERDANGNVTTFTPITFADGVRPYIQKVRDPVGREITYDYERNVNMAGRWYYRVRSVTDPYGRVAIYSYDAAYRLAAVNHGAGRTTGYTYDTAGRLVGVTNARGHTTTIQWTTLEGQGRVTRVTAPGGAATLYAYTIDPSSQRVTQAVVTNARGHATTHAFHVGGLEGYFGNLERLTDPLGNVTQYAYDARHNVTQVTDPRGHRTTYQYNVRNKATRVVRAVGTLNLTTTLAWDDYDNLLSVTNPRGIRTDHTYNAQHNLTHVRKAAGTQEQSLTQYVYNSWGGVTQVIDPRGNTTQYTYTARRQVQQIIPPIGGAIRLTYNAFDDQVTKIDGNDRTWTTEYDTRRLVTRVTDPLGYFIRHLYDENGNRTATWDPKNQATTFTYDNRDRLTRITDPLNGQTHYQYDAVSNLMQVTNARNHSTAFTYDAANRLTQVLDPLNQPTSYQYDASGNRTRMTDRKAQVHQYAYDQANRLTSVIAGGQTISYTYDATGNRLTMADPTGTTTYQYDNLDRQTRATYPDGRAVQATYDRAGNRTSLTNPGGITTTYVYDGANRLSQMAQGTLTWTLGYDQAGNRRILTHPNGTSTDYAYLNNHWLASITDKAPGGATFQSVSYTYDQNGNRLTQTDSSGTTSFAYDVLNRLTQAAHPGGYGTWAWTYDGVGNRTQQAGPGGNTTYTYDANSRLLTAGSTTYSYDANGNLTAISTGQTFAWDVFNRMTQATGPGGTVAHTYNGDGLKTRRVGPDGTRNYYYDGIKPIWETDAAGTMTAQYDRDIFGNLLSRREASGARRYYHFDGLGSTTALTNESGAATPTLLYDAWGNQRAATGSDQGRYRFTGAELDQATGLYHMGARFYDPTIGRWLSEDPVQDTYNPAALNFYAYVLNNPINWVDPTGLQTCDQACLEELNRQRQDAARRAMGTADPVAAYLGYLGVSRVLGHERAMEALQGVVTASAQGDLLALSSPGLKLIDMVSEELLMKLYQASALTFGAGMLLESLGFWRHVFGKDVESWMKKGLRRGLIDVGLAGFILAYWLDSRYYGGRVWLEFQRRYIYPGR